MKRVVFYFKDTKREQLLVWVDINDPMPIKRRSNEELFIRGRVVEQQAEQSDITLMVSELAWWRITG